MQPTRSRILIVCYGNICRSPVAEALLQKALREAGLARHYSVRSAGVGALPGAPAARGMIEAARERGIDLTAHRARRLTPEMAREAEMVIALDEVVEEEIAIQVRDVDVVLWPVDDPYGGPAAGYAAAVSDVESHVRPFVEELRSRAKIR